MHYALLNIFHCYCVFKFPEDLRFNRQLQINLLKCNFVNFAVAKLPRSPKAISRGDNNGNRRRLAYKS